MIQDPIIRRMHACALAFVPCVLWSPPGGGKTARVLTYARARKLHLERWLLSRCEPIDLKPRVYHEGNVIVGEAPEMGRLRSHGGGLAFYDEVNRAERSVEGAALDLIDSPPPGVAVFAACNPVTRGSAARHLGSAAANRFCHLTVEVDPEAWARAQIGGWPDLASDMPDVDPKRLAKEDARVAALVGGFIARRAANYLEDEPTDPVKAGGAWPSTRTWEYVRKLHAMALALYTPDDPKQAPPDTFAGDLIALIGGCVGHALAVEYLAFCADADLRDPEELLAEPEKYEPDPARPDRTIVTLSAMVGAVERNFTNDRWKAAWKIIATCSLPDHKDIAPAIMAGYALADAQDRLLKRDPSAAQKLSLRGDLCPLRIALIMKPKGSP